MVRRLLFQAAFSLLPFVAAAVSDEVLLDPRQEPDGDVCVTEYVYATPVVSAFSINNEYIASNTILVVEGISITVNNAPTSLNTLITGTFTTFGPAPTNGAGGTGATSTVPEGSLVATLPASAAPSGSTIPTDFVLLITEVSGLSRRELSRRQRAVRPLGFLGPGASAEDFCQRSAVFRLEEGHLYNKDGLIYSTNGIRETQMLIASSNPGAISRTFSIDDGQLTWNNSRFDGGSASFCQRSEGAVYAVFGESLPLGCTPVVLGFQPAAFCPNLPDSFPSSLPSASATGIPSFTGPYTTITSGYGGTVPTTVTEAPGSGDFTGTVIVETPTAFTGPYTTITSGYGGTVPTTVTEAPGPGDSTGTVIVETPNGFTGPYTTITSGYGGTVPTTVTDAPGPGDSTGTVIVEIPTGFTGPYTTITSGYGGTVPTTVTEAPAPGDSTGTIIVETPTGFTGPYTTITSGYGGFVTSTVTEAPASGDSTGTVVVETPTRAFSGPYTTITSGYGGTVPTTVTEAPAPGDSTGTVIVETPTAFTGPYTTVTSGYGGFVTSTVTETPAPGDSTGTVVVETPTRTFSGPYTTITSGYGGFVTSTVTEAPAPGGSTGTVVVETPTSAFSRPYTTITSGYDGSVTSTITEVPAAGGSTGTVVVATPRYRLAYLTIYTGYGGSVVTTITESPAPGSTVGTVLIEIPTGTFTGPYTTITSGYGGSVVTTATESPGAGGSVGTVIVETPSSFTGPYTTISSGYSGNVRSTTTEAPGAGGSLGTVIVETPTAVVSSCSVVTASPTPACVTLLPDSCNSILPLNGLQITTTDLLDCAGDLAPYVTGDLLTSLTGTAGTCLDVVISLNLTGAGIVNCLNSVLKNTCIELLPEVCEEVDDLTGSALLNGIDLCRDALGPLALGTTADCLVSSIDDTINGPAILTCVNDALGLENATETAVCTESDGTTCVPTLPATCTQLSGVNGLLLIPVVAVCESALGTVGDTLVSACLGVNGITNDTLGLDLLTCVSNATTCPDGLLSPGTVNTRKRWAVEGESDLLYHI